LSEEEALGFCLLLIVAGNDTTASAIGSGAVLLARHPDQRAALLDDPELWRDAVEEIVRIETPAQRNSRKTTCTVEVAGFVIPEGSTVGMLWGAANHDEREFDQPERFDIRRNAARHLGFGRGIHFCLGASLARLEISIALAELVEHFPDYELSSSPTHVNSEWARCHESIPVGLGRTRSSFR
jgi:cytochrome P450 family 130